MLLRIGSVDLAWDETGEGTPLVLLHGFPFQRGVWAPQLKGLSDRCRVLAPDLPGFGESSPLLDPPSVDAYADTLANWIMQLDCGAVVLGGHSMGGYIALAFARRHPELLLGLALIASRAEADSAETASNRRAQVLRLRNESPEFIAEGMLPRMPRKDSSDIRLTKAIRAQMNPLRPEGLQAALEAMAARPNSMLGLGQIAVEALVLVGEADAIVPLEESGIIAANFRHARLEVVENAGHMVCMENPKAANKALRAYLDRLGV